MEADKIKIYHNPRCSKSRETLRLLEQYEKKPQIIDYLKQPPLQRELEDIINMLGISARELLRTGEQAYLDAGLGDQAVSDEAIIQAICKYPVLLQRPIVISGKKAVIGRPPTRVLDIIQ